MAGLELAPPSKPAPLSTHRRRPEFPRRWSILSSSTRPRRVRTFDSSFSVRSRAKCSSLGERGEGSLSLRLGSPFLLGSPKGPGAVRAQVRWVVSAAVGIDRCGAPVGRAILLRRLPRVGSMRELATSRRIPVAGETALATVCDGAHAFHEASRDLRRSSRHDARVGTSSGTLETLEACVGEPSAFEPPGECLRRPLHLGPWRSPALQARIPPSCPIC